MPLNVQIDTIANEIFSDLDFPTDTSVGPIAFWVQNNIGNLNILINSTYDLNDAGNEITPPLGQNEKDIYKTMYNVYYYGKLIRTGLGALSFESVQSISSDGGVITKIDRTKIASIYLKLKEDEEIKLNNLTNTYKSNQANPTQVTGDDVHQVFPFISEQDIRGRVIF